MHFKELYLLPGIVSSGPAIINNFNKILNRLGIRFNLVRVPDGMSNMHTIEQRINIYHLVSRVLQFKVPGEFTEFGCFNGQSAMVIQKVLQSTISNGSVWLYDSFKSKYEQELDVKSVLLQNFERYNLNQPRIVEGDFLKTVPSELPQRIAFAHIDCGFGGNPELHMDIVLHLLKNIYPRLTPGAVVLFMDYHDPYHTVKGDAINPGVKMACDVFFNDKPEAVYTLFGNQYSHGYIIKD